MFILAVIHKMFKYKTLLLALLCGFCGFSQEKSTHGTIPQIVFSSNDNLELNGTRIATKIDSLLHPEFRFGGYISTYYAHYSDQTIKNSFVQFPTLAPRNNQFSLNMALISMEYKSQNLRGNITLHYGDVPESSWPAVFNMIQEANAGFKIYKKLWLDAGFFKTHIGLESFQPRENITSSMSIVNFYDPYFLSGAKLTYLATSKLSLQACIFNGYNEFVDNNKNKALDFSANYNPNDHISITYNFLTCDETPDNVATKHQRYYQNVYATFVYRKFTIGVDFNFGLQQHTLKSDTTKMAAMYSGLIVAKYNLLKKLNVYGRVEDFSDPNQILSTNVNIGKYIRGTTLGVEFKPQKTAGLSFEWRILESDNLIFKEQNKPLNRRNEFIVCLDLWF
jgi:hypothetical protein